MDLIEHNWYFKESETDFSDNYTERYYLTAVHKNVNSKNILIDFLMNPSHAGRIQDTDNQGADSRIKYKFDSHTSDKTVNLLLRTIGKSYSKVIVINNIPLIEPSSDNIKYVNDNSLNENAKKIKSIVQDKSYDLYVGTGIKGSGFDYENNTNNKKNRKTNTFVRENYLKNINMLCNHTKCNNIYTSGLNTDGIPQHPKPYRSPDDITEFLLNSKRKTKWNSKTHKLERI